MPPVCLWAETYCACDVHRNGAPLLCKALPPNLVLSRRKPSSQGLNWKVKAPAHSRQPSSKKPRTNINRRAQHRRLAMVLKFRPPLLAAFAADRQTLGGRTLHTPGMGTPSWLVNVSYELASTLRTKKRHYFDICLFLMFKKRPRATLLFHYFLTTFPLHVKSLFGRPGLEKIES